MSDAEPVAAPADVAGDSARPGVHAPSVRRVLFLDVDGVLHPLRVETQHGKLVDDHCFQPSCCRALQHVVHATGAEIVVSSSWRCFEAPRHALAQGLQVYGLHYKEWVTTRVLPGGRGAQILDWLAHHGQGVASWAVVDDEPVCDPELAGSMMGQAVEDRTVRTDPAVGLTEQGADALIALLLADSEDHNSSDDN